MNSAIAAAAALGTACLVALLPFSNASAQNQLPTTIVTTTSKPKPKPPRVNRPERRDNDQVSVLPLHPDPETPKVRAKDWNAPGVLNLNYMTEAQFVAFQAAHPTAVFFGRCYAGQDPDINIRAFLRRRIPFGCAG
jgi:hypothetical protein